MHLINITAIAIALAMDAFAVSIATGITLKQITLRQNFRLAWHFGLFQAIMPIIGWTAGLSVRAYIEAYDHWIAFALLTYVAAGMLKEAFGNHESDEKKDPTRGATMVMLSVATSIDALAVGLSLSMLKVSIWLPALVIGIIAAIFTTVGMHLGKTLANAKYISRIAEICGGIVLLCIGLNILREHGVLFFL
ncbi:MAG: manganese efflux pump MntP family protein [Desulfobacteraceae bacterium]